MKPHIHFGKASEAVWGMEEPELGSPESEGSSLDDRAVLRLWVGAIGRLGAYHVFPIPFKEETEVIQDSHSMALRRY